MSSTRTILLTGATSGIGEATTAHLLQLGHRVIGIGRHFDRPLSFLDNPGFTALTLDLGNIDELSNRVAELARQHGDVNALICCAGIGRFGALENFSHAQITELMNTNFTGHALLVKAFLPALRQQAQSDIVFIGSESAIAGGKQGSIYCASKFALRGFAQSLRLECAKSAVRISMINPGMVNTAFFTELDFAPGDAPENAIPAEQVAAAVVHALEAPAGTVVDEINLSPLKKVFQKKPQRQE